jgi:glucose dehydrogenase
MKLMRTAPVYLKTPVLLAAAALVLWLTIGHAPPRARADTSENVGWPYYGADLQNTRYLNADQIKLSNVAHLRPAWVFHTGVHDPNASMETSPIVIGSVMYVTTGTDDVFALRAPNGHLIWHYHPTDLPPDSALSLCCFKNNRGVAAGGQ